MSKPASKPASKSKPKTNYIPKPIPKQAVKSQGKYDPRWCPKFIGWLAREGKTIDEIAEKLGLGRDTIYRWKREYPEVAEAIRQNKEVADYQVEEAVFKRACGYDYNKVEYEVSEVGDKIFKKKKETVIHVPADMTAAIFFLCNRKSGSWRRNGSALSDGDTSGIDQLMDAIKKEVKST